MKSHFVQPTAIALLCVFFFAACESENSIETKTEVGTPLPSDSDVSLDQITEGLVGFLLKKGTPEEFIKDLSVQKQDETILMHLDVSALGATNYREFEKQRRKRERWKFYMEESMEFVSELNGVESVKFMNKIQLDELLKSPTTLLDPVGAIKVHKPKEPEPSEKAEKLVRLSDIRNNPYWVDFLSKIEKGEEVTITFPSRKYPPKFNLERDIFLTQFSFCYSLLYTKTTNSAYPYNYGKLWNDDRGWIYKDENEFKQKRLKESEEKLALEIGQTIINHHKQIFFSQVFFSEIGEYNFKAEILRWTPANYSVSFDYEASYENVTRFGYHYRIDLSSYNDIMYGNSTKFGLNINELRMVPEDGETLKTKNPKGKFVGFTIEAKLRHRELGNERKNKNKGKRFIIEPYLTSIEPLEIDPTSLSDEELVFDLRGWKMELIRPNDIRHKDKPYMWDVRLFQLPREGSN